ncbi:MAG TPA: hypothetical protein VE078_06330, partial [Thermoanaerobaculia bacterium]|nr:hypothetical protein [Thermoanaerobaculia bacterium]
MKSALCWLLFGLVSGFAGAQTFSERTEVVVVEVPVQVIGGDGDPVRGLTAQDFEVYEGRRKLPVTGFEVLDLNATAVSSGAAAKTEGKKIVQPVAARRHFLLLFDLAFSSPIKLARAQEAARDLLEGLHPLDLVAVGSYLPSKGPQLILGFTSDKVQIAHALTLLPKPQMFDRVADPLRLVLVSNGGPPSMGGGGGGGAQGGGKGAERRQEAKESIADDPTGSLGNLPSLMRTSERVRQERAVTALSRAFADLAKAIGGLYGRKYVVLFSEGFDSSIFQGTANIDEQNT